MQHIFFEKTGKSVREMILKKPLVIRWACIYIFIFFTIAFIANVDDSIGGLELPILKV